MFLSESAKVQLPKIGQHLCVLCSQLSAEAARHHLFQHLCEWQALTHGNRAHYWTYSDEDLVGQKNEVVQTCHARTMAGTALFKWLTFSFDTE